MATTFELLQQGSNAATGSTTWEYINDLKTGTGGGTGGAILGIDVIASPSEVPVTLSTNAVSIYFTETDVLVISPEEQDVTISIDETNIYG